MSHEVLEKILSIEATAQRIVAKAQSEGLVLQKQTEQEIEALKAAWKTTQDTGKKLNNDLIEKEILQITQTFAKANQKKIEKINNVAEKNFQQAKDFLLKKIFS